MVAAYRGGGLRLSAEEVGNLAGDEAIRAAALNGLDKKDWPTWQTHGEPKWETLDPKRKRTPQDLMIRAPEDDPDTRTLQDRT